MLQKLIHTSFAPNFQSDDVGLAGGLLLRVVDEEKIKGSISRVKQFFSDMFRVSEENFFCFSSGRSGLYYALKSAGVGDGDEVLLQAFNCVAVPASIIWTGATPVFCDVPEEGDDGAKYNIDCDDLVRKITDKTKAIIVQHTFGIPAQIEKIVAIAKDRGIVVIEDCAHALGVKGDNGRHLGGYGDIAVFSFGRDKVVSSVFGGLVMVNDTNTPITTRLREYEKNLEKTPSWFVTQQLFYLIIYAISIPFYRLFLGRLFLAVTARIGALSKAVGMGERYGQRPVFLNYSFSPHLAFLLENQLKKLQKFSSHREKISSLYIKGLGLDLKIRPYLRVPLQLAPNTPQSKEEAISVLKNRGIHLGNWYRGPIDPPTDSYQKFNYQSCPNAENLANATINLPTHINISEEDALTVIKSVKSMLVK